MLNRFSMTASMPRSGSDQELINALLKINAATGSKDLTTAFFLHMREPDLDVQLSTQVTELLAAIVLVDCAPANKVASLKQQLGITSPASSPITLSIRNSLS